MQHKGKFFLRFIIQNVLSSFVKLLRVDVEHLSTVVIVPDNNKRREHVPPQQMEFSAVE